ncbi:unnamed protein product [Rhizophagus irregularis]|nr:unnamed protein product [Rhizophagus irregularis]
MLFRIKRKEINVNYGILGVCYVNRKTKLMAISERTTLMEEHATAVNSDTDDDRSHKRQRGQQNEDEIHQPATPKNKHNSSLS